jgi:hypothetical protein
MVRHIEINIKAYFLTSVDGGVSIVAKLNGQVLCTSEATYGIDDTIKKANGESWATIRQMSVCSKSPVKLKKGDTIAVEANYDFDLHPRYVTSSQSNLTD